MKAAELLYYLVFVSCIKRITALNIRSYKKTTHISGILLSKVNIATMLLLEMHSNGCRTSSSRTILIIYYSSSAIICIQLYKLGAASNSNKPEVSILTSCSPHG
ncbi:uncharacterized protein V2V93DRAFT_375322 [Kockiozyma suomiensis]|uniref:uncharacterized protein n=1 Tax=Kockiozyma suomiensis TaxID=1337062 RepID=UPI003343C5E9